MQIYQILNKKTGKSYVGKSKNYIKRFKTHLKCAGKKVNRRLYDSINHHGKENFELILLEELGDVSRTLANTREIYWIEKLNTLIPYGYNMTKGGDGGDTLEFWDEASKTELYRQQGQKRKGKRSTDFCKTMSVAATEREANKSNDQKSKISEKISNTLKRKYASGELTATTPKLSGKNHPHYVHVDITEVLNRIKCCQTLSQIAQSYSVSRVTIGSRLKNETGKTFIEWRQEYGIVGRLSNPRPC